MSTKYKSSKDVPTDALISRLNELSDAIAGGRDSLHREFTMRIPAECDRDADLVIGEAASRLARLQSEVEKLRGRCAELESVLGSAWASHCLEAVDWVDQAKEVLSRSDSASWLLRKQAEAVEAAKHEHALTARIPDGTAGEHFQDGFDAAAEQYDASLDRYAQRLRQQADELEENQQ